MNKIDLARIDLNLLVVFEVLMSERHVTRAADRLGRTQSALSHALARLRDQLGDPLLVRVGGAMRPTPRALALVEDVRAILGTIGRVLAPPDPFVAATSDRMFRIVSPDFWADAIAAFLAHAAQVAPGVRLEWRAPRDTSMLDLRDEQVDLFVAPSAVGEIEGVRSAPIGELVWRCYMRRGHPAAASWGIEAWRAHPHLVVAVGDRTESPIKTAARALEVERRVGVSVPSFASVAPLLARTDLIATLPSATIRAAAASHGLVDRDPPIPLPPIAHRLYWAARTADEPAMRWLRDMVMPLLMTA